jgi:hypothetical protein
LKTDPIAENATDAPPEGGRPGVSLASEDDGERPNGAPVLAAHFEL